MRFMLREHYLYPELLCEQEDVTHPISSIPSWRTPSVNLTYSFNKSLQQKLSGKHLLLDELSFPLSLIQRHYENGYLTYHKGIKGTTTLHCNRCGNEKTHLFGSFHCARCKQVCMYCRSCIQMGRVSQCTPLLTWCGPPLKHAVLKNNVLQWRGHLSSAQQVASAEMMKTIRTTQDLLIWAVCGAGKTEVLFQGIEEALCAGKSVCIATPRTDVVIELQPRLQQAFPDVKVVALYSGSPDKDQSSLLVLSTTHQLLRYYEAFDVMIIDEVDAFPYSVEIMLQYAVQKACKKQAAIIYLTATPNEQWKQEVATNKRHVVKIPARYHRKPIPVPEFQWCGNWQKFLEKKKLSLSVIRWLTARIEHNKQCFLFIPNLKWISMIVDVVKELTWKVAGVHAEDEHRKQKIEQFRKGKLLILVTTTILERGVTIPNLDVAVLGAENNIFTESALVQIAGRVGRSADFPTGDIVFFHFGQTAAMQQARKHIIDMNNLAKKQGLIDL
ncbi:DEAD/DEAH box helicase [Priestia megaterium]|nr:DEAD/DEAH box helicase [Priestia megaterium]